MSRIGNKPIVIPEGIEVKIQDSEIIVKGQKGELLTKIVDDRIKFEINEGTLIFSRDSDEKEVKSLHGLYRSLVANNIVGVTEGYKKTLSLQGVGHRATLKGNDIEILCGFSHPVIYKKVWLIHINSIEERSQKDQNCIFHIFFTLVSVKRTYLFLMLSKI